MSGPVGIALIGMGWWGQKILTVLQGAPADIRVVRAVEPNIETVKAVCAEKGVPLSARLRRRAQRPNRRGRRARHTSRAA